MKRLEKIPSRIALIAIIVGACATDIPTEAPSPEALFARGGGAPAAYTSVDLGVGWANDVNDAGDVAGGSNSGAFAVVAGTSIALPGGALQALAISQGSPRYVVGWGGAPSQPLRWVISNGQSSQPTTLALGDTTWGSAGGVNDGGVAVGSLGTQAAVWNVDGTLAFAFRPEGFTRGEGRDINNAGDAVFVFWGPGAQSSTSRAYIRLASGTLVQLPPLGGDVVSYANALTEVSNDAIYIAGTSGTTASQFRSVRWTVNATSGIIVQTQVRSENSHALGVSVAGGVAGFIEPAANSLRFKAFLWRGAEFLLLNPPKSGKDPRAWAISGSGEYVAGEAFFGTQRHAVRWRITAP